MDGKNQRTAVTDSSQRSLRSRNDYVFYTRHMMFSTNLYIKYTFIEELII